MLQSSPRHIQNETVLWHLRRSPLTCEYAWHQYNVYRLAARVFELREEGHDIRTYMIETPGGKHIAQYWLARHDPLD